MVFKEMTKVGQSMISTAVFRDSDHFYFVTTGQVLKQLNKYASIPCT